jgi:hypothetical protein
LNHCHGKEPILGGGILVEIEQKQFVVGAKLYIQGMPRFEVGKISRKRDFPL